MTTAPLAAATVGSREVNATRAIFFAMGLAMASWGPLVPIVKARLVLDEGALGLLLLCLGLGSVVAMPFSGTLATRFGCRLVIATAGIVATLMLPLLATAPSMLALALSLAVFGAGIGTVDVVMNIQATIVEKEVGQSMMSGFHGLVSVGGILGAGGVTLLLSLQVHPLGAILLIPLVAVPLVAWQRRGLLPYGGDADGPPFVMPRGQVILIGALCFVLFLTEGAMLDWSAVFLTSERGVLTERAGWGYVAFATMMSLGRLTGDALVRTVGRRRILTLGALLAAGGLLLVALAPLWPLSFLGFAMVGAGASNSVPILFSAAGHQKAMPPSLAIGAVTTMGYAGLLAGPAGIGFVARGAGLPVSFLLVALLLIGVSFSARLVTRPD